MVRKRASLKDKGEEILGVKRSGQGLDILFGTDSEPEPTLPSEGETAIPSEEADVPQEEAGLDESSIIEAEAAEGEAVSPAPAEHPVAEEGMPRGEADLDEEFDLGSMLSAEAVELETAAPATAEYPLAEEGMPQGEADLDEESYLDSLLSAEAEAAEGVAATPGAAEHAAAMEGMPQGEADLGEETALDTDLSSEAEPATGEVALPELATTPAAPSPPPSLEHARPAPPPRTSVGPSRPATPAPSPIPPPPQRPDIVRPSPADSTRPPSPPTPAVAPPSTTTGAPDLSVPRPPRQVDMVAGDFDLVAEEESAEVPVSAPESAELTADERADLLELPTVRQELAELDKDIDRQYERILRENVSVNPAITDWCHNLLAEARAIVLGRQVEKLAKAEWNIEQVRARLDRAEESRKQSNRFAWPIAFWGMAWFFIFVYFIFNPTLILSWLYLTDFSDQFLVPEVFLRALLFGGIGGVAAVFYHLFKYVRLRSFDGQYILSYIGKPFMGMILGSMNYLTIFVVMRFFGLAPLGLQQEGAQAVTDVMFTGLLFFVAMAAGFKENLAFDLLNRVIKAVLRSDQDKETSVAPGT